MNLISSKHIPYKEQILKENFYKIDPKKLNDQDLMNKVGEELSAVLNIKISSLTEKEAENYINDNMLPKVINVLKNAGFDDVQSWSLIAASLGIFKFN